MLTVELFGGLGNQLFQLAFLEFISAKTQNEIFINSLEMPKMSHVQVNYYNSIFKNWVPYFKQDKIHKRLHENTIKRFTDYSIFIGKHENILFSGYFQNYKYIEFVKDKFVNKLTFNTKILEKFPFINHSFFIHIRGGDFKQHHLHNVNLTEYYKKCIDQCQDEVFVVFTDDVEHAKLVLPTNIPYDILILNELDTLYLMSKCKGGICANSTFSWWGAYLNPERKIFFPSKMLNGINFDSSVYHVPGWNII